MTIKKDNLDQLLSRRDPKQGFSEDGLFDTCWRGWMGRLRTYSAKALFRDNRLPARMFGLS